MPTIRTNGELPHVRELALWLRVRVGGGHREISDAMEGSWSEWEKRDRRGVAVRGLRNNTRIKAAASASQHWRSWSIVPDVEENSPNSNNFPHIFNHIKALKPMWNSKSIHEKGLRDHTSLLPLEVIRIFLAHISGFIYLCSVCRVC